MSKIEVNTVEPQCGTTLTLGASGDTVTLGAGASQSGFGRTGTVDWQTGSIKTATFTAANGEGYFANTSGGAFTMNLPAGTAGNIVSVVDYTNTFQTNNLTVSPNGSQKIGGIAENAFLSTEGQSVTFVYVDDTEGWKNIQDSTSNITGTTFICGAVSGSCNTLANSPCGNYKIATFKGPGTFTVNSIGQGSPESASVDYVVVAGGGAGAPNGSGASGAGGAGGFRFSACGYCSANVGTAIAGTALPVTATGFPITVGGGGSSSGSGSAGSNTIFSTITSAGGGVGGLQSPNPVANPGGNGGSGGGGSGNSPSPGTIQPGGSGNTPPVSPSQGNSGGSGVHIGGSHQGGGGGGGGDAVGTDVGTAPQASAASGVGGGGKGLPVAAVAANGVSGPNSLQYFAGGGGGGVDKPNGCTARLNPNPATGGTGGGGNGGNNCTAAASGTANTGGGGGGGISSAPSNAGGAGGSGIVIIRYKFQ